MNNEKIKEKMIENQGKISEVIEKIKIEENEDEIVKLKKEGSRLASIVSDLANQFK